MTNPVHVSWSRDDHFQGEVEKMQKAGYVTKVERGVLHPGEPSQWLLYAYPFAPVNPEVFDEEGHS